VSLRVHGSPPPCLSAVHDLQCFKMTPKKPAATAEVALIPLKNCLVNLPPSLVALLVNANTVSLLVVMFLWIFFRLTSSYTRLPKMLLSNYNINRPPERPMELLHSNHASSVGRVCRASAGLRLSLGERVSTVDIPGNRKPPPSSLILPLDGSLVLQKARRYTTLPVRHYPRGALTIAGRIVHPPRSTRCTYDKY
jgi:hypothetical protein